MGSSVVAIAGQESVVNQPASDGRSYTVFNRLTDIKGPPPSMPGCSSTKARTPSTRSVHGEHGSGQHQWRDWPANYHGNNGALAFADGHAETHKWSDPAIANYKVTHTKPTVTAANPSDLQWLRSRTTSFR